MKFINYLEKISGVSIYGLSSLLIFGTFFLIMLIWAIRADKDMITELSNLPLDKTPDRLRDKSPESAAGKITSLLLILLLAGSGVHAEGPAPGSSIDNPFVIFSLIIILILAIAIGLLANVLLGAAQIPSAAASAGADLGPSTDPNQVTVANPASNGADNPNPDASVLPAGETPNPSPLSGSAPLIALFIASALTLFHPAAVLAQDRAAAQKDEAVVSASGPAVSGLSDTAFYMVSGVILLEVIVLLVLLYNVWLILGMHRRKKAKSAARGADVLSPDGLPAAPVLSWWDKLNRFKPIAQEVDLDLGHDYDGIRELDNRLPPWWLYGFYITIIFAFVYLWRYHIAHTAPLSGEEYAISVQQAEQQKVEYLKKAASQVDENTVKLLTSADDLEAGKTVFETTCFACHGKSGEGGVGPNLTDEYWLHGGTIQDIFKTIKYGWPDKGMKSWKDDFPPARIAQIASYVKSLQGTHPANAKAPQGTLSK